MHQLSDGLRLDAEDPLFNEKKIVTEQMNQASELLTNAYKDKNNFILYLISIFSGSLIGSFFQAQNYLLTLAIANFLMALMIYFIYDKNREIKDLESVYTETLVQCVEYGLPLPRKRATKII